MIYPTKSPFVFFSLSNPMHRSKYNYVTYQIYQQKVELEKPPKD